MGDHGAPVQQWGCRLHIHIRIAAGPDDRPCRRQQVQRGEPCQASVVLLGESNGDGQSDLTWRGVVEDDQNILQDRHCVRLLAVKRGGGGQRR